MIVTVSWSPVVTAVIHQVKKNVFQGFEEEKEKNLLGPTNPTPSTPFKTQFLSLFPHFQFTTVLPHSSPPFSFPNTQKTIFTQTNSSINTQKSYFHQHP